MVFTPAALLGSIRSIDSDRISIALRPHLDNVGNLSFDLFYEISQFLCLPASTYISFKPLIDESLLASRNRIAHGEFLAVDQAGYDSLLKQTLSLMQMFKTDLENSVVSKGYLRQ
jgi:hypothetical protein